MSTRKELNAEAKALGINSFGKSSVDLEAEIAAARGDGRSTPSAREPRAGTREAKGRQRRVPLGTQKQKLNYESRPGYVRRWINDTRTRIKDAEAGGYEFVLERDDGRDVPVSRRVGVNEDGSPMKAYLMEIRQEFYDEDQREKQRPLDEFDAQLRSGRTNPQGAGEQEPDKYYTPSEGTSLRVEN